MLDELRKEVLEANLELVRRGLVLYTFGNVSGIDREAGLVAIKPSGVPYERMTPEDMVITDLEGKTVEGRLRPSSDLETHLVLYRKFRGIGGVAHTHSEFATIWAQAAMPIPCRGTTHADYFHGPVPVTGWLEKEQVDGDYERNTGEAIAGCFAGADPCAVPAALVAGHGPFCWGGSAWEATHNAVVLEMVARMAWHTAVLAGSGARFPDCLLDRHFFRKHGAGASYGQR